MGSKLSPEQKALNKEAAALRTRAYKQRKEAYRTAQTKALGLPDVVGAVRQADKADAAFNNALIAQNLELAGIQDEIQALTRKLEEARTKHKTLLEPLREARNQAYVLKNRAERAAQDCVDAEYPDMVDCWSAAAWKPLSEFLPGTPDASGAPPLTSNPNS